MKERINQVKSEYLALKDWEARYKLLIEEGRRLPLMKDEDKSPVNLVKGCQSQVWLSAKMENGKIIFSADSDAAIVKGLVALLVRVYSQSTIDEVLQTKPVFIEEIGLKEHLTMSRANGLISMLKQMNFYALAFRAKEQMGN